MQSRLIKRSVRRQGLAEENYPEPLFWIPLERTEKAKKQVPGCQFQITSSISGKQRSPSVAWFLVVGCLGSGE